MLQRAQREAADSGLSINQLVEQALDLRHAIGSIDPQHLHTLIKQTRNSGYALGEAIARILEANKEDTALSGLLDDEKVQKPTLSRDLMDKLEALARKQRMSVTQYIEGLHEGTLMPLINLKRLPRKEPSFHIDEESLVPADEVVELKSGEIRRFDDRRLAEQRERMKGSGESRLLGHPKKEPLNFTEGVSWVKQPLFSQWPKEGQQIGHTGDIT